MRKHDLKIVEENLIKKYDHFEGGEGWQPWQLSSWRNLRERTVEILYQGIKVNLTEKKTSKPFFELSKEYIGLFIDPKIEADIGLDLLIIPHSRNNSPIAVPLTYSVDVWPLEILLVFRKGKFTLSPGDPIAEAMLVYRSETSVKKVFGEEEKNLIKKRENIINKRSESTRKENFSGVDLDNYYEIVKRKSKIPPRPTPVIFKRDYAK